MNTITKVIILAGGKGQRLQPLTFAIPKPLIPVGETPILELLLKSLKLQGFNEVILAVGYKSEMIKTYFGDGAKLGMKIKYFDEKEPLGTAGPVRAIRDEHKFDDDILLMNGDIITTLEFNKLVESHKNTNADLTVVTTTKSLQSKYGVIQTEGNTIKKIHEKPSFTFEVSSGIYVLNKNVFDLITPGSFGMDQLINKASASEKKVHTYPIKEYWMAVDLLSDMEDANKDLTEGRLKEWIQEIQKNTTTTR